MVVSENELLENLIKNFDGQKICVIGAKEQHKNFLNELNKKVNLVFGQDQAKYESVVLILSFGVQFKTSKKNLFIAENFWQAATCSNAVVCTDFLSFKLTHVRELCAVVCNLTVNLFNFLCGQILISGKLAKADSFNALKDILQLIEEKDIKAICKILTEQKEPKIKAPIFCPVTPNEIDSIAASFLFLRLCEEFLIKKPFKAIFLKETFSQSIGIELKYTYSNCEEICFKLKEFNHELLMLSKAAKKCVFDAFKIYKRTHADAAFNELKNLNTDSVIKNALSGCGFSLVTIASGLGIV